MRPSCLLTSALLLALPTFAAAQSAQRPEVQAAAAPLQAKVVQWRRDFHQHPELSNREERTAATVAAQLRKLGLKPRTGIAHHGVVAIIKGGKPGPRIALRADMDALPVKSRPGCRSPPRPPPSTAVSWSGDACLRPRRPHRHPARCGRGVGRYARSVTGRSDADLPTRRRRRARQRRGRRFADAERGPVRRLHPQAVFGLHVFSSVQAGKIAVRSGPLMAARTGSRSR